MRQGTQREGLMGRWGCGGDEVGWGEGCRSGWMYLCGGGGYCGGGG